MADLDRIKRNVEKMAGMNAPTEDIDGYIASEGVTLDQVRAHKMSGPKPTGVPPLASGGDQPTKSGGGFWTQFAGNIPRGVTGTMDMAETFGPMAPARLLKQAMGQKGYTQQYDESPIAPPKPTDSSERLGATLGDFVGGSVLPGAGWIGGARSLAASAAQPATSYLGRMLQGAAAETAKHPYKSAGFDLASALTGGTAKHAAEESGAGPLGQTLAAIAGGMAPAAPSLLSASPIGSAYRYMTGRGEAARGNVAARAGEWDEAGVRPFAPALTDNVVLKATGEGGAGSVFGSRMRQGAQGSIDDTLGQARALINTGTGGEPVNDAAAAIQGDLRRSLLERTIPGLQVRQMTNEGIEQYTGPVGVEGFRTPRPIVSPIDPVFPPMPVAREIDDASIVVPPVMPERVEYPKIKPQYTKIEDVPYPQGMQEALNREGMNMQIANERADALTREFVDEAKRRGIDAEALFSRLAQQDQVGRMGVQIPRDESSVVFDRLMEARKAADEIKKRYDGALQAANDARAPIWQNIAKQEFAQQRAAADKGYRQRVEAARAEADAKTKAARQKALAEERLKAEQEAAAKRAEVEANARRAADDATRRAQAEADAKYYQEMASRPGFTPGRTRESYLTEFDMAYERVGREVPKEAFNPMGGPTVEGRAAKTAVKNLVADLADDARQSFSLRGSPTDETGRVTPEFEKYLRQRLGADIGRRISELSRAAPGHAGTFPEALRDLRTAIRRSAEDMERPLALGETRSADAAALRRLHGALTEDMHQAIRRSGGPAEAFQTETGAGSYVPRDGELMRSTSIGGMKPSDMTVYMRPEHMDRLTGSRMPNDHKGRLSPTMAFDVDGAGVMVRKTATGEADRATRVPFSFKPEVGMRPMQMWDDGGIHFGAPVTSRVNSPGERASEMMRGVDNAYGNFIEELRRPLAKLYGADVKPIEAMNRITKAAAEGDLKTLRAFMRVMNEKGDPRRAATATIAHLTQNAETLPAFIQGLAKLPRESRAVLFGGQDGAHMLKQMEALESIGKRLMPYSNAMEGNFRIGNRGPDLANPTNLTVGILAVSNFYAAAVPILGAAGIARFMASPKYMTWLTRGASLSNKPQVMAHLARLGRFVENDNENLGPDMVKAVRQAVDISAHATMAGENAANLDIKRLEQAQRAQDDGADANDVWQKFGWYKGRDGGWRTELDDTPAKLKMTRGALMTTQGAKLGDVLEHADLFKAYPELADLPIRADAEPFRKKRGVYAHYSPERHEIVINPRAAFEDDGKAWDPVGVILHEVQHAISGREGFRYGDRAPYQRRPGEAEAMNVQNRRGLTAEQRQQWHPGRTMSPSEDKLDWRPDEDDHYPRQWGAERTRPAIRQDSGGARQSGQQSPFQTIIDAARRKGLDPSKASPQDVIDAAWDANPTDEMGELIDAMAEQYGLTPPWKRKK